MAHKYSNCEWNDVKFADGVVYWLKYNLLGICCVVRFVGNGSVVAVNYGFVFGSSSSFGLMKNALNAKQIKTIPPTMVTVR